jgi:hypothetical protein
METSKQKDHYSPRTGKITRNVARKILERLDHLGVQSPSLKPYTPDMVRNWLYCKSRDPKIEAAYLFVLSSTSHPDSPASEEKRNEAKKHIEIAERLLAEI